MEPLEIHRQDETPFNIHVRDEISSKGCEYVEGEKHMVFSSKHFPVKERIFIWKSCTWKTIIEHYVCICVDTLLAEDISWKFSRWILKENFENSPRLCVCAHVWFTIKTIWVHKRAAQNSFSLSPFVYTFNTWKWKFCFSFACGKLNNNKTLTTRYSS